MVDRSHTPTDLPWPVAANNRTGRSIHTQVGEPRTVSLAVMNGKEVQQRLVAAKSIAKPGQLEFDS